MSEVIAVIMYIMFTNATYPHQSFDNMTQCEYARTNLAEIEVVPMDSTLCVPLYGRAPIFGEDGK